MGARLTARPLTGVELATLADLANGTPHRMIARGSGRSQSAVSMRLSRLFLRLGLVSTPQLIAVAVREGWIVWDGQAWQPRTGAPDPGEAT